MAVITDLAERKRQEERIHYLATHDPLTDLPNRRALEDSLTRVVARCQRGRRGALLLLDLDELKLVNDTVGHPAGDRMLTALAGLLRKKLRPGDLLARLGGDEFAVLLEDTPVHDTHAVAERLRQVVDEFRFTEAGRVFDPAVSVGMAVVDGSLDPQAVLALADTALYAAKDLGRNRTVVYRPEDQARTGSDRLSPWPPRIKDALRENRPLLHYQSVVQLATGRPEYYEALIRLRDEAGRLVEPKVFLPAAERFGLMPLIDRWLVGHLLDLLRGRPGLRIFANLSGPSLKDYDLLEFIQTRLAESGVAPGQLGLEITESVAVADLVGCQNWMHELRRLGCGFALDDFALSSFSYLRALPVDYVKVHGAFVRNLDADPTNRALVQAMGSGKRVIGEWVESGAVAAQLERMGFECGQGFYWGEPEAALPEP